MSEEKNPAWVILQESNFQQKVVEELRKEVIPYPVDLVKCGTCEGTGKDSTGLYKCSTCNGTKLLGEF